MNEYNSIAATNAVQDRPLSGAMHNLSGRIDDLEAISHKLIERLQHVLVPVPESPGKVVQAEPSMPPQSPLQYGLNIQHQRLRDICVRLEKLLQNIEQ